MFERDGLKRLVVGSRAGRIGGFVSGSAGVGWRVYDERTGECVGVSRIARDEHGNLLRACDYPMGHAVLGRLA
jgi:hypothetical protein